MSCVRWLLEVPSFPHYFRNASAAHPSNLYPAMMPIRIPTQVPLRPDLYPYESNIPLPAIRHWEASSV